MRAEIRALHAEHKGRYGRPRLTAQLRQRGWRINPKRVYRILTEEGLKPVHKRPYKATTDSAHAQPVAPNTLDRAFSPTAPNQVWATDITCLPTAQGWAYIAVILDLYSRKVIGVAVANHMRTELCETALTQALVLRQPAAGWLHHSDRGSQYTSTQYQALLAQHQGRCSMSRKGNCWDNAVVESFFHTLKVEYLYQRTWESPEEVAEELMRYLHGYYNAKRLHSHNQWRTPNEAERHFSHSTPSLAA